MANKVKLIAASLGWGVQSWTIAAMCALGEMGKPDFFVHADTDHEKQATYFFAETWTPWLIEHGCRVVTVQADPHTINVVSDQPDFPAFTINDNGGNGQLRRQCTGRWKITPIRRFISAELKRHGLKKTPGIVEAWLGISLDEISRVKDSDVKYINNCYPLLDLKMTRQDCLTWLDKHHLPAPEKSACIF
jgi:3'-phosphoadenosine 5'-phosphosulfate sulfotransferase (PAPS reductase)/FAD synthetase